MGQDHCDRPGPGPVTVLHLEIHSSGAPVHVELAYSWDEPPQYGSPEMVRDAFIDQALAGGPGSVRERKLLVARNMLDRGVISQADYDRMIAGR